MRRAGRRLHGVYYARSRWLWRQAGEAKQSEGEDSGGGRGDTEQEEEDGDSRAAASAHTSATPWKARAEPLRDLGLPPEIELEARERQVQDVWFRKHYTGRHTRCPGADGFDQEGYNDQVVPGCLSKNDRKEWAILWKLLRDEGRALGFVFSSVQLNKNFQANRPHHHRRTDKDHQWCLSLGEFTGGDFCWQERDQCFSVSTKDQWQKVDGRLRHWVLPHQPQKAIRYSIVLFRNKGAATEIFYHSDAAKPK